MCQVSRKSERIDQELENIVVIVHGEVLGYRLRVPYALFPVPLCQTGTRFSLHECHIERSYPEVGYKVEKINFIQKKIEL